MFVMQHRQPAVLGAWGYQAAIAYGATETSELRTIARLQVEKAEAGSRISSYRDAADYRKVMLTSGNLTDAYLRAAYWLAVAARISGNDDLVEQASARYRKGSIGSYTPFVDEIGSLLDDVPRLVQEVYENAARWVEARGGSAAAPVASILRAQAEPAAIENKRRSEYEQSAAGMYVEPTVTTAAELTALTHDPWSTMKQLPWWGWMFVGLGVLAVLTPLLVPLVQARVARRPLRRSAA